MNRGRFILLHGIYGTGKTTLARLLPNAIEQGKSGTDDAVPRFHKCLRGQNGANLVAGLTMAAMYMSANVSSYHYFVLDEVDLLTDLAMESLKSAMNTPQTIFIMTTNHLSKIEGGVKNRCILVDCNAAPAANWLPFAKRVLASCGGDLAADNKLLEIIATCNGSAREISSSMQELALMQKQFAALMESAA